MVAAIGRLLKSSKMDEHMDFISPSGGDAPEERIDMTNTEFNRIKTVVREKWFCKLDGGVEICSQKGYYGTEYFLYSADGNCVTVEWDIENMRYILV